MKELALLIGVAVSGAMLGMSLTLLSIDGLTHDQCNLNKPAGTECVLSYVAKGKL